MKTFLIIGIDHSEPFKAAKIKAKTAKSALISYAADALEGLGVKPTIENLNASDVQFYAIEL